MLFSGRDSPSFVAVKIKGHHVTTPLSLMTNTLEHPGHGKMPDLFPKQTSRYLSSVTLNEDRKDDKSYLLRQ